MTYKFQFVCEASKDVFEEKCTKLGADDWEMVAAFTTHLGNFYAIFQTYIAP